MTFHIFVLHDVRLNIFQKPIFDKLEKVDFEESVKRSLTSPQVTEESLENKFYYLGTYNDVSGKFDLLESPEFIFDINKYRAIWEISHGKNR